MLSRKTVIVVVALWLCLGTSLAFGLDAVDVVATQLTALDPNKRYGEGRNGPDLYDCSGLTWYAFGYVGIEIATRAITQSQMTEGILLDTPSVESLQRGDLLFFDSADSYTGTVNHVGIYEGDGWFIQAVSVGHGIVRSNLLTNYVIANPPVTWKERLLSARRLPQIAGLPSSKFQIGDVVTITEDDVRVRQLRQEFVLGTRKTGDAGTVIFGPVRQSLSGTAHWWWMIRFEDGLDNRWVAEEFLTRVPPPALVVGGNDTIDRTFIDEFVNFTVLDRNRPISTNGTVTAWEIYARDSLGLPLDPLQLAIFRQTGPTSFVIVGTSDLSTPVVVGVNTFTLGSPIAVQAGDFVGLRYAGRASVPYQLDPPSFSFSRGDLSGTMLFTGHNSGLTNFFLGSSDRTYSIRVIGEAVP